MGFLKFLGTAGARFVVMHQLRASGGLWLSLDGTNLLIDPGPGCLLRCLGSQPKLDPAQLDGILLTHRHLDHVNDVNIMIEAMTNGGFHRKGTVFAPHDALIDDPVIFKHARQQVNQITALDPCQRYTLGTLSFTTSQQLHHSVETYGITVNGRNESVSLITDTEYFPELSAQFPGDLLVINVVLQEKKHGIQHLALPEAEMIIAANHPKLAVLTHFGMTLVKAEPQTLADDMTKRLGITVIAATDGLELPLH